MNEGRIYHILLMAAYLWPEGQRVQKEPAEYVRQFIEKNYGEQAVTDGMAVLKTLRSQNKMLANSGREDAIDAKLLNAGVNFGLQQNEVDILLDMTKPVADSPRTAALRVLGLQPNATKEEIKAAYRRLSLKYHPDRNVDKSETERKEAEQRFKEIVAAKQVLDNIRD